MNSHKSFESPTQLGLEENGIKSTTAIVNHVLAKGDCENALKIATLLYSYGDNSIKSSLIFAIEKARDETLSLEQLIQLLAAIENTRLVKLQRKDADILGSFEAIFELVIQSIMLKNLRKGFNANNLQVLINQIFELQQPQSYNLARFRLIIGST